MLRYTTLEHIADRYNKGIPSLLYATISADLLTPVSALLTIREASPYHFLFESVEGGKVRGRYSIVGADPDLIWRCLNGKVEINRNPAGDGSFEQTPTAPFTSLRNLMQESALEIPHPLPPMLSGIFGYMGYDMVRLMEELPLPPDHKDPIDVPDSIFIRPKMIIVFDSVKDEAILATPIWVKPELSAEAAYKAAEARLEAMRDMLSRPLPVKPYHSLEQAITLHSHIDLPEYTDIVNKAKEYIKAGDIFQVVPSRRVSADFTKDPFAFYRSLRKLNPSPYLFYVSLGDFVITGSSPEILVRLRDGKVTIRPIAGTRKRGRDQAEDAALKSELLADQKDLSEHLMLLDLGRNDVGRVAKPGTVRVTEQMVVEFYSHVMHIVSNVEGELREGLDAIDALIAGFPAGTVSGAPKIRAMEIIDELESEKRAFYGGCVGYISANGSMDTCIALRTALIKNDKLYLQAGGGVVADSDPEAEFVETENKAAALKKAAELAASFGN
jgi:anthranilate synthase component I